MGSLVWLHSAPARQCRVGHCAGGREEGGGKREGIWKIVD